MKNLEKRAVLVFLFVVLGVILALMALVTTKYENGIATKTLYAGSSLLITLAVIIGIGPSDILNIIKKSEGGV